MIYWISGFFTVLIIAVIAFYVQNHKNYTLVVAYDEALHKEEFNGLQESIEAAKTIRGKSKNIKYGMVIHNITGDIRYRFETAN